MNKLISREECKSIQIEILDNIAEICKENGLNYYLAYGTLLGAIRHKGFIPWDDDIDIYLSRSDYNDLVQIIKNRSSDMPDWLELYDGDRKGYYYPFAKAVDSRTRAKMEDNVTEHGIWIDIFPIDKLPLNHRQQVKFVRKGKMLRDIIIAMTTDFTSAHGGIKKVVKRVLCFIAAIVGKDKIYNYTIHHYVKYQSLETDRVACLSTPYGVKEIASVKEMFTPSLVEFEGKKYQATQYWDSYLRRLYGDYTLLPPEEKRRIHSITATKI